ncbi:pyroglutamyl-peptidase I [Nitratireductor thuwali]|uniref:Pyrrolidone-carboxylate peptidase n=1 Tax=Nitratireductor thuwali TaxID=2267699 RepID=A0ABY5MNX7_9HYPH|nr:Pyrrolidone-carboxylate peptidase [Nitratireductor thuwali]
MAAGAQPCEPVRPRVLVTGFGPFPGAPVNPTEWLVEALGGQPWSDAELRAAVLAVEYATVAQNAEKLGESHSPDIAIHFGLSAMAQGFTLERIARNEIRRGRADSAGELAASDRICDGEAVLPSTLPLAHIEAALKAHGLPVSWSDDAGGYLCNYLFYLSRSPQWPRFAPAMSGFIHVPPLRSEGEGPANGLCRRDMLQGAGLIVAACIEVWLRERRPQA